MEYILNDPLTAIACRKDPPKEIIFLESHEIKKLMAYKFHGDIFRITADLFLFQCFTGLSYSDIYKHQVVEKNGKLWIEGNRVKTNENYKIFFFDEAREIYLKYEGKLPKIANRTYNLYLKEIAGILKINKHLTTHVGRKTHATILHERGVSTETISVQLGNTERVCNESYIKKSHVRTEHELHRIGFTGSMLTNLNVN